MGNNSNMTPDIGHYQASIRRYDYGNQTDYEGHENYTLHQTEIKISSCNPSNFLMGNWSLMEEIGIQRFQCIDDQDKIDLNGLFL